MPAQAIAPFIEMPGKAAPRWKPVDKAMTDELAAKSAARISKDEKFLEIIKNNGEAAAKKDVIRISDLRKEMEKEGGGKQAGRRPPR